MSHSEYDETRDYDEIAPEYRFDLTRIYETPADWDAAHDALDDRLDDLRDRAADSPTDPTALRGLLETVEECYRTKQRLELYAKLAENVNQGDEAAEDRLQRFHDLEPRLETAVGAVRRRFAETDDDRLDAPVADLDEYRYYAGNFREQARHVRSPDVEETMATLADTRRAPTDLIDSVWADFDPPTVDRPDGGSVEITRGNRRSELSHPDRDYRRRVYEAYWAELDGFEHVLTEAFAAKLRAASAEAEVRGYDSVRDRDFRQRTYPESGLESALPGAVHDRTVETVRANLDPYHRAFEVRRERLGVDEVRPWDLEVSITEGDPPEIDYETAREYILAALEPLGEDYVDRVRSLFAERRIDPFPAEGKWDVPAYCPSSAADGPYVLANFRGDVRTTFFVCHELGHAMHVEHHRRGPARYATCPRPVEEVPSILHELLLAEHLQNEGEALAAAARNRLLECVGGNFYGSTMASAFVHRLAGRVADGEAVTPERARDTWADLQAEFEEPVSYDDRAGRDWLGRGQRPPYSSYQYVLGATGALAVREQLREGDLSVETYREFLRSTGRERSVTLFERLGCDLTATAPYERAAAAFDDYVDAVESAD